MTLLYTEVGFLQVCLTAIHSNLSAPYLSLISVPLPEPETLEHIVDEYDEFMIIATDGVWDVIDNNQAVQMVANFVSKSSHWNTLDASNTITKFARSRWEKLSPMVDDITCIVCTLRRS